MFHFRRKVAAVSKPQAEPKWRPIEFEEYAMEQAGKQVQIAGTKASRQR
jgi:hypothetical protein